MAELDFERLKQDFDRDGFAVLRGYLSAEELAEMWDHLHRYHAQVEGPIRNGKPTSAIKGMNIHDDWYRDYLENGRHIPLMKFLIEDDLAPDNVTWLHKPKGVPRTIPHYDAIGSYRSPLPVAAVIHTALTVHWTFDPIEYRDRNAMVFVYWGASSAVDPMRAKKSRSAYADGAATL